MNMLAPKITRGPGEPHPNDEHAWKCWWVRRMFDPKQPMYAGELKWVHQCWKNTMALWHTTETSGFEECVSGLPKGEDAASEGRKYNVRISDPAP